MINHKNASLVVVGCGIKALSHITIETKAYIEQSQKVLYLVNDPLVKEWIYKTNPNSESMDDLYFQNKLRIKSYNIITEYILETLRSNRHVCVVMYGHPIVFAQPALDAVIKAKLEGFYAKVLPAISAEDCLFADVLLDPGTYGCQSWDATDFLIYKRKFDSSSALVLWQLGILGELGHAKNAPDEQILKILVDYLSQHYPLDHKVVVYEAAQYPTFEPSIEFVSLNKLTDVKLNKRSTLYIPPCRKASLNKQMARKLGIKIDDLMKQIDE